MHEIIQYVSLAQFAVEIRTNYVMHGTYLTFPFYRGLFADENL